MLSVMRNTVNLVLSTLRKDAKIQGFQKNIIQAIPIIFQFMPIKIYK